MKNPAILFFGTIAIAALSFGLLGCPQTTDPAKEEPVDPRYSISLDRETYSVYVPIGSKYFAAPEPLKVKITNTGEIPTKNMTVVIKNDEYKLFELSDDEIPSLAPGEKAVFTVTPPQHDQGWTSLYKVDVVVGNKMVSKTLKLEYGAYYYIPVDLNLAPSFLQAGSVPTVTADAERTQEMPWFSSNSGVAVVDGETVKLTGDGEAIVGYISVKDPLTVRGKAIKVYREFLPPWIVSASIDAAAPEKVRVTFNEPVDIVDKSKIKVKVNSFPSGNSTTVPYLDIAPSASLSITAAVSAAGGDGKVWNLTMSAPAKYGEILRLETTEPGAAEDSHNNELPKIPQFIIKNTVKRVKDAWENEAGFYIDGMKQTTTANASLLRNALTAINNTSAANRLDKTWTIVLGEDQTFTPSGTFSGGAANDWLGSTIIITSEDNVDKTIATTITSSNGLTARNGLTLIIDEHVIFEGRANVDQLIRVMDQAKIILDGGEIRNNTSTQASDNAGGVRIGGGSNGAWFIMNSGKITGNTAINNSTSTSGVNSYGGGVSISDWGVFVMYDGEISGNIARGTNTGLPRAGGIAVPYNRGSPGSRYQNNGIFILGGEIKNNKVEGSASIASAGGILAGGVFQKTGGTIQGNETSFTGNVKASQVAVILTGSAADPAADAAAIRNAAAGPDVGLIVEYGSPNNTIPDWAPLPSYWE